MAMMHASYATGEANDRPRNQVNPDRQLTKAEDHSKIHSMRTIHSISTAVFPAARLLTAPGSSFVSLITIHQIIIRSARRVLRSV
jgi:hypothetical protein